MRRKPQLEFTGKGFEKPKDWFGGSYLKNSHAKSKRPFDPKLPLHVVLRAEGATHDYSMRHPRHFGNVNRIVRRSAHKYGIRIYEYANVGNHLHLLIRVTHRELWASFIREVTGRIARSVQCLEGWEKPAWKFWSQKPFTRIVHGWRRAYKVMKDYILLNSLEGQGQISRLPRRNRLSTA